MRNIVLYGDCLTRLKEVPDGCVQTCVTSPPYFGLRDYGVKGQIGLEPTPAEYVAKLIAIFMEVRRVLRDDGTVWLNLGDSYASERTHGVKPKDLIGIPWRVAFALQDDGWHLRAENIWHKPVIMPESVRDRTTRSHEYVFMLTKSKDYFYDTDAVNEPAGDWTNKDKRYQAEAAEVNWGTDEPAFQARLGKSVTDLTHKPITKRNRRSVWTINPKPYKGAHFAVFPPELPEICIKAGTSQRGSCSACGAPYERVMQRPERPSVRKNVKENERDGGLTAEHGIERTGLSHFKYNEWLAAHPPIMTDWKTACSCNAAVTPCIVLDPFAGSGTTLAVAKDLDRDFIGIELNEGYRPLIEGRITPAIENASQRENFRIMMDLPNDD